MKSNCNEDLHEFLLQTLEIQPRDKYFQPLIFRKKFLDTDFVVLTEFVDKSYVVPAPKVEHKV